MINLNQCRLRGDWEVGGYTRVLRNHSAAGVHGAREVSVYFRGLEDQLVEHISRADAVFGAVAWLTNSRILEALATVESAQIVVQKEDFLRPDGEHQAPFYKRLRRQYSEIENRLHRNEHEGTVLPSMSFSCDSRIEGVRCVGNHNTEAVAAPRMHNKFLVFAHVVQAPNGWATVYPYGVWTGSFNMTATATRSFENAVYITAPDVVHAYHQEYAQIVALSEPLDWTAEWVAPEWRLGS